MLCFSELFSLVKKPRTFSPLIRLFLLHNRALFLSHVSGGLECRSKCQLIRIRTLTDMYVDCCNWCKLIISARTHLAHTQAFHKPSRTGVSLERWIILDCRNFSKLKY